MHCRGLNSIQLIGLEPEFKTRHSKSLDSRNKQEFTFKISISSVIFKIKLLGLSIVFFNQSCLCSHPKFIDFSVNFIRDS